MILGTNVKKYHSRTSKITSKKKKVKSELCRRSITRDKLSLSLRPINSTKKREMGSFHDYYLFSLLLLSSLVAGYCHGDSCKRHQCTKGGPVIQFPFRIKEDGQPPYCGYPGFDLISCQDRTTFIRIPSINQDLVVKDINYTEQMIMMMIPSPNPKDCIWRLFLNNLNLSVSPFVLDSSYESTFINCSKNVDFIVSEPISCLSDLEHDVFAVSASLGVNRIPVSCQPTMTVVGMPLPKLDGYPNIFSLRWNEPRCKEYRSEGFECGFNHENSDKVIFADPPPQDTGIFLFLSLSTTSSTVE